MYPKRTVLVGVLPARRYIKGNVTALNSDGSYAVATSNGATILARPLGQAWAVTAGVFVQDGRIVDSALSLPGIRQFIQAANLYCAHARKRPYSLAIRSDTRHAAPMRCPGAA